MCYAQEVVTAMGGGTARDVVTSEGVHPSQRRNTIGWAMGGATERASDIIGRLDAIASEERCGDEVRSASDEVGVEMRWN